jgi:hypothetical protein
MQIDGETFVTRGGVEEAAHHDAAQFLHSIGDLIASPLRPGRLRLLAAGLMRSGQESLS